MSTGDNSTRPFNGSEWETSKDTFAPRRSTQQAKGWERASVSARAPRLQGHKIWKRNKTRSQPKVTSREQDVQNELEIGGIGSRKRLRLQGANEDISEAPWLEAQDEKENALSTMMASKTQEGLPDEVSASGYTSDSLRFVPRKRTNINHVITPRKPLRQTTLNAQRRTASPLKTHLIPTEESTKRRKSTRKHTRTLSKIEIAEFDAPKMSPSSTIALPTRSSPRLEAVDLGEDISRVVSTLEEPIPTEPLAGRITTEELQQVAESTKPVEESAKESGETAKPSIEEQPTTDVVAEKADFPQSGSADDAQGEEKGHILQPNKTSRKRRTLDEIIVAEAASIKISTTTKSPRKMAFTSPLKCKDSPSKQAPRSSRKTAPRSTKDTQASSSSHITENVPHLGPAEIGTDTTQTVHSNENDLENFSLPASESTDIANKAVNEPLTKDTTEETIETNLMPIDVAFEMTSMANSPDLSSEEVETNPECMNISASPFVVEQIRDMIGLNDQDSRPEDAHPAPCIPKASEDLNEKHLQEAERAQALEDITSEAKSQNDQLRSSPSPSPGIELTDSLSSNSDVDSEASLINFSPEMTRTITLDIATDEPTEVPTLHDSISAEVTVILQSTGEGECNESADEIPDTTTPHPTTTDLTETITTNAPVVTYDNDDTDMLRNFLNRVKANKAAKAEAPPKRKRSLPHSPLRLPLGGTEDISFSPPPSEPNEEIDIAPSTERSSPSRRRKRADNIAEDENSHESKSIRRSGRTRLPVKTPPPGVSSLIPVRRLGQEGDSTLVLKRNVEKELAAMTRVNTRKNKGSAISAAEFLAKKVSDKEETLRQPLLKEMIDEKSRKKGKKTKTVVWAEQIAQYQRTEQELAKDKSTASEEKKSAVKVGIRSKIALGMAVNGTPAKRKVKTRM